MASTSDNRTPTDSASTLRDIIGRDPTATFEDDPAFVESNPTGTASSENLGAAAIPDDEDEDDVDEEDLEDDDDLEDDEGEEVEEGFDEDDEDDDDIDDEDDEDDDDDEEDDEDDAKEAGSAAHLQPGLQVAAVRLRDDVSMDEPGDDDAGDDGRENAVDEDDLITEQDADLDDSSLTPVEAETIRKRLVMMPPSAVGPAIRVRL